MFNGVKEASHHFDQVPSTVDHVEATRHRKTMGKRVVF